MPAPPLGESKGKKQLRLCFEEPALNKPEYRIAVVSKGCFSALFKERCVRFKVLINGTSTEVLLNRNSLRKRFGPSDEFLDLAIKCKDLTCLALRKLARTNPEEAPPIAKKLGKDFYFPERKEDSEPSIYLTQDFVASGVPGGEIVNNGRSRIKKANLNKRVVAMKIVSDTKETIDETLQITRSLCGKPHVIDLLGSATYTTKSTQTLVTFHPFIETTLAAFLRKERPRTKATQYKIADQLFKGLESLGGAHGDVKPKNVLIDGEEVRWIDLELYKPEGEDRVLKGGSPGWAPPEAWKQENGTYKKGVVRKFDVFGLGKILFALFTPTDLRIDNQPLSAWGVMCIRYRFLPQREIDNQIDKQVGLKHLTPEEAFLIKNMVVIDLRKRFTLKEAASYFRTHILLKPQEGLEIIDPIS